MTTIDNPIMASGPAPSKWPVAIRWGVIGGLASAALTMVWHVAGLTDFKNSFSATNLLSMLLGWAISLGVIVSGIKQYRDQQRDGFITFGEAFFTGFLVALVVAVFSAIFTAIYMTVIAPDIMETAINEGISKMEEQGLDDEQIDNAVKMTKIFTSPIFLTISALFGGLFSGAIFALIGAAIMKKDPPRH